MLEKDLERYVVSYIEHIGGICAKITVIGDTGWPDRIVHYNGMTAYLEFKRNKSQHLSKKQKHIALCLEDNNIRFFAIKTKNDAERFLLSLNEFRPNTP